MGTADAVLTTIGERIRARRLELGMTQADLAGKELTGGYVSLIECGRREPSQEALRIITQRLNLRLDELLRGTPPGLEPRLELQLHQVRTTLSERDLDEAIAEITSITGLARQHGLNRVEAHTKEALGEIAESRGDLEAALAHFRDAEELWKDEPIHLRVDSTIGAARCARFLGEGRLAVYTLDSYRRDLTAMSPDPHALMKTYTELIHAYFGIGLPESAQEAAHAALQLAGQVDDPDEIGCMHLTVARTLLYEGKFDDALVSVRRAHETYSAGRRRNKAARARIAEGIILSKKRDYSRARARLAESLDLLAECPDRLDEALALNELGRVTRNLDDPAGALAHLRRARSLLVDGDVMERAFNEREIGACLSGVDNAAAEGHLRAAFDLYRICRATDDLAATCKALGDLYLAKGDKDAALAILREAVEYVEERSS